MWSHRSLKTRLALIFGLLAVLLTGLSVVPLGYLASAEARASLGTRLQDLAVHMADALDGGMFERYRDIQVATELVTPQLQAGDLDAVRALLRRLQSTYPAYAWIGVTDPQGRVRVATGGLLEGADVSARPWYSGALEQVFAGDVHEASLLAKLLDPSGTNPPRFVDVAAPLIDPDSGARLGVIGAHLDWAWAQDVEASVRDASAGFEKVDVLVIGQEGRVLLGPQHLRDSPVDDLGSASSLPAGRGWYIDTAADGQDYLMGYAAATGHREYPGLGWTVLVRMPLAQAMAPVRLLQWRMLGFGLLLALIFCGLAWYTARRTTAPLLQMANEVRALRQRGLEGDVSPRAEFPEVEVLSQALRALLRSLRLREQELLTLNAELDERVALRTRELEYSNLSLSREVDERKRMETEREQLIERLHTLAHTDGLTGVANRRHFYLLAEQAQRRSARSQTPMAFLILDIDHFKRINDQWGHAAGDAVLKGFVERVASALRDVDLLARLGGEEFAVLLENASEAQALQVAERIREAVGVSALNIDGQAIPVTVSIGAAVWRGASQTLDELMHQADLALYAAKQSGRNRVCLESALQPSQ